MSDCFSSFPNPLLPELDSHGSSRRSSDRQRYSKAPSKLLLHVDSVLHTIVDRDLRAQLEEGCRALDMPHIGALDPLVGALSRYLGAALSTRVGAQHALDNDYFNRISALDYAMAHDDGQGTAWKVSSQ